MRTTTNKKSKVNDKKKFLSQQDEQEYQKYLEELCDPNYQGGSWSLPENPTPLEVTKYEMCKQVIRYKRNKNLTIEKLAQKFQLSKAETEDILYYRIDHFTLDRLMSYINSLLSPKQIKITVEEKEKNKNSYVRRVV